MNEFDLDGRSVQRRVAEVGESCPPELELRNGVAVSRIRNVDGEAMRRHQGATSMLRCAQFVRATGKGGGLAA